MQAPIATNSFREFSFFCIHSHLFFFYYKLPNLNFENFRLIFDLIQSKTIIDKLRFNVKKMTCAIDPDDVDSFLAKVDEIGKIDFATQF